MLDGSGSQPDGGRQKRFTGLKPQITEQTCKAAHIIIIIIITPYCRRKNETSIIKAADHDATDDDTTRSLL